MVLWCAAPWPAAEHLPRMSLPAGEPAPGHPQSRSPVPRAAAHCFPCPGRGRSNQPLRTAFSGAAASQVTAPRRRGAVTTTRGPLSFEPGQLAGIERGYHPRRLGNRPHAAQAQRHFQRSGLLAAHARGTAWGQGRYARRPAVWPGRTLAHPHGRSARAGPGELGWCVKSLRHLRRVRRASHRLRYHSGFWWTGMQLGHPAGGCHSCGIQPAEDQSSTHLGGDVRIRLFVSFGNAVQIRPLAVVGVAVQARGRPASTFAPE
jgi:hypothetical protein